MENLREDWLCQSLPNKVSAIEVSAIEVLLNEVSPNKMIAKKNKTLPKKTTFRSPKKVSPKLKILQKYKILAGDFVR